MFFYLLATVLICFEQKQASCRNVYILIVKCTSWPHFPLNSFSWHFTIVSIIRTLMFCSGYTMPGFDTLCTLYQTKLDDKHSKNKQIIPKIKTRLHEYSSTLCSIWWEENPGYLFAKILNRWPMNLCFW